MPNKKRKVAKRKRQYITRKRFVASILRQQTKETLVRLTVELGRKLEVRDKQMQSLRLDLAKLRAVKLLRS